MYSIKSITDFYFLLACSYQKQTSNPSESTRQINTDSSGCILGLRGISDFITARCEAPLDYRVYKQSLETLNFIF